MRSAWHYGITALTGAAVAFVIMWSKGIFTAEDAAEVYNILSDAFFVPGVVLAGFGLLVMASNGGAFDMLAYGMQVFFSLFRKNPKERKYQDFYEYQTAHKERKHGFGFLIIVGLCYIALAGVFSMLWYNL